MSARPPMLRIHDDELVVDSFAGGGGASLGIEWALGRSPDVAINHDAEAIAMHAANHPATRHFCESVWDVDPKAACAGRRVALAWFSPDCKHFSKAKGGKPVEKKIRGLAWIVVKWARAVKPRVICLENVEEFQDWGPLLDDGRPCPVRRGRTFRRWVRSLERAGYVVESRELRACDYGAPTTRKRLFVIARSDGERIVWPEPTHGPRLATPWRVAAECIEWALPCPSIFERVRPLAENTLRRIARGIRRYVIEAAEPFIVPITHTGDQRVHGIGEPFRTITGAHRGEHALVTPFMAGLANRDFPDRPGARVHGLDEPLRTIHAGGGNHALVAPYLVGAGGPAYAGEPRSIDRPAGTVMPSNNTCIVAPTLINTRNGEREGQAPRVRDIEAPFPTVTAQGSQGALVAAFLARHYGGHENDGAQLGIPLGTITARDHHALVASHIVKLKGTAKDGQPVTDPLHTIHAGGLHYGEVRAFLCAYFGNEKEGQQLGLPMRTVTTKDRFGLVTVHGQEYAVADIGMRMLQARELFRAQGFPDWRETFRIHAWHGHEIRGAEGHHSRAENAAAQPAEASSSHGSARGLSSPVAVSARIDLGRNVLVLRSPGRSFSSVANVDGSVSFPLPIEIAASAHRLAPTHSCLDPSPRIGRADGSPNDSASTPRGAGIESAMRSGIETAPAVADAPDGIRLVIEDSKSTTSPDGRVSPSCAEIRRTLSSYVVHAIASCTRSETPPASSYEVELTVEHSYIIDPVVNGRPISKTAQVRMCGNSVCPPLAAAIARAQFAPAEAREAVA